MNGQLRHALYKGRHRRLNAYDGNHFHRHVKSHELFVVIDAMSSNDFITVLMTDGLRCMMRYSFFRATEEV